MDYFLLAPFLLGLFSTVHCIGMCGGIMGALAYSLPAEVRSRPARLGTYVLGYNLGRIVSYTLAGAVVGMVGERMYRLLSPVGGYHALQIAAALLVTGAGLYLAGWFPKFALMERIGVPLWRRLEPLGRKLLPVRGISNAFVYGLIWGWLPCGLVYSALLLTVTADGPAAGAAFMAAFGLGTLPAVTGTGMLVNRLARLTRRPYLRQAAGVVLIALALVGLFFADELHRANPLMTEEEALQCTDERL